MKTAVFTLLSFTLIHSLLADTSASEASGTKNIGAFSGKWRPVASSQHLLDPELVDSNTAGFEITIDKVLGASHRKASYKHFYDDYAGFLKEQGHEPVATGYIKFECGGEDEHVISRKNGSLYLWHGIVSGGNPRIFLGRGTNQDSVDSVVIEWTDWCGSGNPMRNDRKFATIVYERR